MLPVRIKADLILGFVAMLWGSAFAVQRAVSNQIGVLTFNGLRFLLASICLMIIAAIYTGFGKFRQSWVDENSKFPTTTGRSTGSTCKNLLFTSLAGLVLFLASYFQQAGLQYTTAANAGFITSLYVILVPILLWVFWREKIPRFIWTGACLAVFGSLLLSVEDDWGLSYGDLLELVGALFWGLHVILISKVVWRMDLFKFVYGQYFVAGVLNLTSGLWVEKPAFFGLSDVFWGVFYTGIFSIALGYSLQIYAQKYSPAADTAMILSLEAVFAAIFGYILLDEILLFRQIIGCMLILTAILVTAMQAKNAYRVDRVDLRL